MVRIYDSAVSKLEIENNNNVYFLLNGVVFIGLVYSLMPIFEILLRIFFPSLEVPFYR